jgi:putative PIG3 family NAD(P)H quinone oxidoreductase
MRAITTPTYGDADVLTLTEIEAPALGEHDVRITVMAAGVNGADLAQRRGTYPSPVGAPSWPGLEVSGTIAERGSAVTRFHVGDEVCALTPGGGYAEQVVVDARLVLPLPHGVAVLDAAGLPEVCATVYSNVFMLANLQPGETLLVHGGSSGIGSMAIQLAVAVGAKVITTVGNAEKLAFVEGLGATGINYNEEDFVEVTKLTTDGAGADVILDLVGGEYLARNIRALAIEGRIMSIANQSGEASTFTIGELMMKRGRIWGTTLRSRPLAERTAIIASVREMVWPLFERGLVHPVIDSVFAAVDAADAHRRVESSAHIGKVLIRFS